MSKIKDTLLQDTFGLSHGTINRWKNSKNNWRINVYSALKELLEFRRQRDHLPHAVQQAFKSAVEHGEGHIKVTPNGVEFIKIEDIKGVKDGNS